MRLRRGERGFSVLLVGIVLISSVAVVAGLQALAQSKARSGRADDTRARFALAHEALANFVAQTGRLPCPANATDESGTAAREADGATCTYPLGSLPWRTLGMRREDTLDAWDRRIAYRVYTGTAGSLAQDGGASMTNCHTDSPPPSSPTQPPTTTVGSLGGLCVATHETLASEFLVAKGFGVYDFSQYVTGVAYVLLSHGATGYSGYSAAGAAMPAAPAGDERNNATTLGPFRAKAASDSSIGPDESAHFDDLLGYMTLRDLTRRAGMQERIWLP